MCSAGCSHAGPQQQTRAYNSVKLVLALPPPLLAMRGFDLVKSRLSRFQAVCRSRLCLLLWPWPQYVAQIVLHAAAGPSLLSIHVQEEHGGKNSTATRHVGSRSRKFQQQASSGVACSSFKLLHIRYRQPRAHRGGVPAELCKSAEAEKA